MSSPFRHVLTLSAVFLAASVAHAHPGHDGHELTWDFRHLAAHPLATLGCIAILAAAAWGGWKLAKAGPAARSKARK